jgi:hypothetical protein
MVFLCFEVLGSDSVSWDVVSCSLIEVYLLSEECIASVFRIEEWAWEQTFRLQHKQAVISKYLKTYKKYQNNNIWAPICQLHI